jgi:hypothetical protein
LNKKYFKSFNDVLLKHVVDANSPQNTDIFSVEYRILDYNTFAKNNTTKCKSNGSVLALDKKFNKWHLYPDIYKENQYSVNNLMGIVDYYEKSGIDHLDEELTHMLNSYK